MKKLLRCLFVGVGLYLASAPFVTTSALAKQKAEEDDTPRGSIRPKGKPTATGRAALARISFQDAMAAALAAVPGQMIYGELEIDDGNLDFDFEVIGADKKVAEVQIDAGNGRVLAIDEADDE